MTPRSRKPPQVDDGLPDAPAEDVTLSNGKVFRLRGLSIAEMRAALAAADESEDVDAEASITAACTVQPKITASRMAEWLKTAAAGDARKMTSAAMRLCAIDEGATKSSVSRNRDRSTSGE